MGQNNSKGGRKGKKEASSQSVCSPIGSKLSDETIEENNRSRRDDGNIEVNQAIDKVNYVKEETAFGNDYDAEYVDYETDGEEDEEDLDRGYRSETDERGSSSHTSDRNSKILTKHNSFYFLTRQSQSDLFPEPLLDDSINLDMDSDDDDDDFDDGQQEEKFANVSKGDNDIEYDKSRGPVDLAIRETKEFSPHEIREEQQGLGLQNGDSISQGREAGEEDLLSSPLSITVKDQSKTKKEIVKGLSISLSSIDDDKSRNKRKDEKRRGEKVQQESNETSITNSSTSPPSPSTLKDLLLSPKFVFDSEEVEEETTKDNTALTSGGGIMKYPSAPPLKPAKLNNNSFSSPFSLNFLSGIQDEWARRKLEKRKAAHCAVGSILRPAYLSLSDLYIDRDIEEGKNKIYILVTSVDCKRYEYPISRKDKESKRPPWKVRGQIKTKPFYLKSGNNPLKERLLLPAVSSDTVLVISLVQMSERDSDAALLNRATTIAENNDNSLSEEYEPDFIWAQAFYSIHDVKCTVQTTPLQLDFQLPTETKATLDSADSKSIHSNSSTTSTSSTTTSPNQNSLFTTSISPTNLYTYGNNNNNNSNFNGGGGDNYSNNKVPFPFEVYHTDDFKASNKRSKRKYFLIHTYNIEETQTQAGGRSSGSSNNKDNKIILPKITIKGETEFVHNSRSSSGKVVVLFDQSKNPNQSNENKRNKNQTSRKDSRKSVFNDDYIFDNNVTQETLSVADIEYEEAALEDPQNTYWLVIAKEIYLLRSYLDTDTASPKMEGHRLCDIHYVNGPLIGHCTKSILVHVGNEAPWRIVTTNEEEYLHWFQILNAVAFESNFLES